MTSTMALSTGIFPFFNYLKYAIQLQLQEAGAVF